MKYLVIFVLVVVAKAEPPRFGQRLQRIEAPYAPAGFRPAIPFTLPARVENPAQQYGPPAAEYGPPANEPDLEPTTTEQPTEEPATEQAQRFTQRKSAKLIKNKEEDSEEVEVETTENKQNDQPQQQGVYYILLPTGQLQKVQYLTNGNVASAAYTTQIQYQSVDPIRGPIFGINANGQLVQLA